MNLKLESPGCSPNVTEFEVYTKIRKAKKPRSGTEFDVPKEIINEFAPELATPLSVIFNRIFKDADWPLHWKLENIIPIPKVPNPESEEDYLLDSIFQQGS